MTLEGEKVSSEKKIKKTSYVFDDDILLIKREYARMHTLELDFICLNQDEKLIGG